MDSLITAVRSIFAGDRDAIGMRARLRAERDYLWENTLPRLVSRYADLARTRANAHETRDAVVSDEIAEAT